MRFLSFMADHRPSYGVATSGGVFDLGARIGSVLPDLKSFLEASALGLARDPKVTGVDYVIGEFTYLPVIPGPQKILCVGLNYEEHRRETGRVEAAHPALFTRFADTLIGHEASIVLPSVSGALDYEGELAVVIGKPGFRIAETEALDHVAGYACFNDATLRDWQRHTHQFTPGKNFPGTGPLGPELVTPDEVGDLRDRGLVTRLNGAVVQSAKLGDMIFSVPRIIAYISAFTRLHPGDVIATGTPGGVGFKRDPQLFMKAGDVVEVVIGGIGALRNPVAAEAPGNPKAA
jgi:2-keto-4-pentenoate hydratase/2-oxohepta-3-ene-1,7-dioic acid hydratase in catechol pathway